MRPPRWLGLLVLASGLPLRAQTSCVAGALANAAAQANTAKRALHNMAVPEANPLVPAAVATQLAKFKDALTRTTQSAFSCAPGSITPETMQATLAKALEANLPGTAESPLETSHGQEVGAYGSGLTVQVFELSTAPRFLEIDFRYSIECGDDHLLLIYRADSDAASATWHQQLRWDAPAYRTVADALGDFVLLTPLTGSVEHPHWRYLVAHGHPACGDTPHPSTFDMDLLDPTADPTKPDVDWHFDHPYTQGTSIPRLQTTEDTIEFRLNPAPPDASEKLSNANAPAIPKAPEVYRFHLAADGSVAPSPAAAADTAPATTH